MHRVHFCDNVILILFVHQVVLPNGDVVKTASRARKSAAGCVIVLFYIYLSFLSLFFFFFFFLRITWEDKYLKFLILILRGVFWKITDQIIAGGVSLQILFVKWCFAILDSCFWSFQNGWPSCTCRGCLQLFLISIALEDFCFIAFLDESTLNHIGSITLGMIWLAWWSEVKGPSV